MQLLNIIFISFLLLVHCDFRSEKNVSFQNNRSIASIEKQETCFKHLWNIITQQELDKNYKKSFSQFLDEGAQKYLNNGQLILSLGKNRRMEYSGLVNYGIWFVNDEEYGSLVIKAITCKKKSTVLQIDEKFVFEEIRNAKAMYILDIGPKSEIVKFNGVYYLIMEEIPGINIKEILTHTLPMQEEFTKQRIEKILNKKFTTLFLAKQAYARALVNDKMLIARMQEIGIILDRHNYQAHDLQMMVAPSIGDKQGQALIIDVPLFRREGNEEHRLRSASYDIRAYINFLKVLAHQEK